MNLNWFLIDPILELKTTKLRCQKSWYPKKGKVPKGHSAFFQSKIEEGTPRKNIKTS